jgi:hypothetical protein
MSYRELPWDADGRICNAEGDCYVPARPTDPVLDIDPGTLEDLPTS